MTDLELTKLCAEAMGYVWVGWTPDKEGIIRLTPLTPFETDYAPLHDDAQAMALVKRFKLDISQGSYFQVWKSLTASEFLTEKKSLNLAICECVAKMQLAKHDSHAA